MELPKRPKFVVSDFDRHGNERIYARKDGKKARLRGPMFSAAFWADYAAWQDGTLKTKASGKLKSAIHGSLRYACQEFFQSADFMGLADRTRYVLRLRLENICRIKDASGRNELGNAPLASFEPRHMYKLLDRKASLPHGANNDLRAMRGLFNFAIKRGHVRINPAQDVKALHGKDRGGFHSWTREEADQFRARHSLSHDNPSLNSRKARFMLEFFLLTGVRRSDAVKIGAPHIRNGADGPELVFSPTKGQQRRRKEIRLPALPALIRLIDEAKGIIGPFVFLQTEFNKPFTSNGFGNWFKRRCVEAGLRHCSAHGLRKLAAVTMAENGATANQLMAVFGWATLRQAQTYTRAADQARLAAEGMPLLLAEQAGHKTVPLFGAQPGSETKPPAKQLKNKE